MSDEPWSDPEMKAWAQRVLDDMLPKLKDSAISVSLMPSGETDVKFAVELGFTIMLNKPIILLVSPGQVIPPKLVAVADRIVESDLRTAAENRRLMDVISEVLDELPKDGS